MQCGSNPLRLSGKKGTAVVESKQRLAGRFSNDSSNTQGLEVQKKRDNERAVHKIGT